MSADLSDLPVEPVDDEPVKAAPPPDELERLDPQPRVVTLSSGRQVSILPLRLRQFLRLLRIITRGASGAMEGMDLDLSSTDSQFATQLVALVLFAIPEAEDETVDFIRGMVEPTGLTGVDAKDLRARMDLDVELNNPSLDDTLDIVTAIIEAEASDLRSLGNRLRAMLAVAERMGATRTVKDTTTGI